jgi:phenylacetate-CoA ligase
MTMLAHVMSARVRRDMREARARWHDGTRAAGVSSSQQLARVAAIWADAVADVPYYSQLVTSGRAPDTITSWSDFQRIPILTRQDLQDHSLLFVRRSGPADGFTNTAGSTGTPLRIGMSRRERALLRVVKLAEWQALGYSRSSRMFLIWGHAHLLGEGWRARMNQVRRRLADQLLGYRRANAYHLNREKCEAIAEQLIRFRPHGLIGYAAAIDLFARYTRAYRERFHALSLGFVLVTTEAPPRADTREQLEDLFGCPVVEEYGGGEFGQVAFKRGDEPFHVYGDLNYLECDSAEPAGGAGYPALLTCLYDRYTPLVRYRVGDSLLGPRTMSHGHVYSFDRIAGRLTDTVAIRDGDAIHSLSIFHCVHEETAIYNVQMRLRDDGIDILLVTAPGTDRPALEARIRPRFAKVHPALGQARIVYVDDVKTSRAGKRQWCIDERTKRPICVA